MMKQKKSAVLLRLLPYLRGSRLLFALSLLASLFSVLVSLSIPLIVGASIDRMITGGTDFGSVFSLIALLAVLIALSALAQWLSQVLYAKLSFTVLKRLREDAMEKLSRLPLSYIDSHMTGELVSRVIGDCDQVSEGLLLGFSQFFTGVFTILGTLVFMLIIHPVIALAVVLLTPISLFTASFIAKRTHKFFKRQSELRARESAIITETLSNADMIDAYGEQENACARFDRADMAYAAAAQKAIFYSSLTNPVTRFVNSLIYAAVALLGALAALGTPLLARAAFSVGSITGLLSYANQYTKPFNEISGVIAELQNAIACAERVFELLDEEEPVQKETVSIPPVKGAFQFEHVKFGYTEEKTVLHDITFDVQPGMRVAIIGPTGCGKSTLINLLMRFYEPQSGRILMDGVDISSLDLHEHRKNFGMVLQDTWLRCGTVRENIAEARPNASDAKIEAAARMAHAHSFIMRLPKGYDTVLSENGDGLSEGQKQLLCIARVMLSLPPVLVLDEATSSIDLRTEVKVQSALSRLMQGRTAFIVAHRLATIKNADLILVMKDGRIIEQGTHETLYADECSFYRTLYRAQFEGVSEDSVK